MSLHLAYFSLLKRAKIHSNNIEYVSLKRKDRKKKTQKKSVFILAKNQQLRQKEHPKYQYNRLLWKKTP